MFPYLERYYLVDKGYPNREGFMVPYSRERYHQQEFVRTAPKNIRQGFNRLHSSLRSTIERCFGVLKKRWQILKFMPSYSVEKQIDIITSCFALHNYILHHKRNDLILLEDLDDEDLQRWDANERQDDSLPLGTSDVRDEIATQIWSNKRKYSWMF